MSDVSSGQRKELREVAKEKDYSEMYVTLRKAKTTCIDWLSRDQAGKDVQQVRVIKDRGGDVLTSQEIVLRRWKEHSEELMKKMRGENEWRKYNESGTAEGNMKSGNVVCPDGVPVEVWR